MESRNPGQRDGTTGVGQGNCTGGDRHSHLLPIIPARQQMISSHTQSHSPLYSMPHLSLTITDLPVSSFRKGLGFTGTVCGAHERARSTLSPTSTSMCACSTNHTTHGCHGDVLALPSRVGARRMARTKRPSGRPPSRRQCTTSECRQQCEMQAAHDLRAVGLLRTVAGSAVLRDSGPDRDLVPPSNGQGLGVAVLGLLYRRYRSHWCLGRLCQMVILCSRHEIVARLLRS